MSVGHNERVKKKRQILRYKSKVHVCGGGGRGNIDRRHNMHGLPLKEKDAKRLLSISLSGHKGHPQCYCLLVLIL